MCIYNTTDGGSNWTHFKSLYNLYDMFIKNENIFAAHLSSGNSSLYYSKINRNTALKESSMISEFPGIVSTITQNNTFGNTILACGYYNKDGTKKGFVNKSSNEGKTWQNIYESANLNTVYSVTSLPDDENYIIFGSEDGIFKTEDSGNNWEKIYDGRCIAVCSTGNDQIFAAVLDKLILSSDNGETWELLNEDNPLAVYSKGIKFDNKNKIIYIGTGEGLLSIDLQ